MSPKRFFKLVKSILGKERNRPSLTAHTPIQEQADTIHRRQTHRGPSPLSPVQSPRPIRCHQAHHPRTHPSGIIVSFCTPQAHNSGERNPGALPYYAKRTRASSSLSAARGILANTKTERRYRPTHPLASETTTKPNCSWFDLTRSNSLILSFSLSTKISYSELLLSLSSQLVALER